MHQEPEGTRPVLWTTRATVTAAAFPEVRRTLLPTVEAAAYLGFKTTGGLRKAHLEQRIFPAGRRGGRGTYVWSIDALDRFLRGDAPVTLEPERSGAPPNQGAHHDEAEELEVVQELVDIHRTGAAPRLAAEGRRARRSGPRDRPKLGSDRHVDERTEGRAARPTRLTLVTVAPGGKRVGGARRPRPRTPERRADGSGDPCASREGAPADRLAG